MNSTLRDFLILILATACLFTVIYGWIAYSGGQENNVEEQKEFIGEELKERFAETFEEQLHFIKNDYTNEFAAELNRRFSPLLEYETGLNAIHIVQGSQVNAFTTVGDRIYLYKGLISHLDDPDMVAAVVAHELGHIHYNHVEERLKLDVGTSVLVSILTGGNQGMLTELGRTMMGLSFSRSQEEEADEFALNLLEQAGIHPQNLSRAFLRMKSLSHAENSPAFLSSHPALEERIEKILDYDISDDFTNRPIEFPWADLRESIN